MQTIIPFSPASLATELDKQYLVPQHIEFLDKILIKTISAGNGRLLVNMPPRHGKSELISKFLPFWFMMTFPQKHIILTTYESSFSTSWGRKVRDLVEIHGKIFGNDLDKSSHAANHFRLKDKHGSMTCVGAGGSLTGRGADLLIIDDPLKNDAEANSPHQRELIWDWFRSTAFTRIEPNGAIIVIMTRWHEDDLTGRIIATNKDDWRHISLPAIADNYDPLGRQPGEALWAKRFPLSRLLKIRDTIGSYWFSALYQQSPTPQGDGLFKRAKFRYFNEGEHFYEICGSCDKILKSNCVKFATVDLAISSSERADMTAIIEFAVTPGRDIFVLNVIADRISPVEHITLIKNRYLATGLSLIGIESIQYQTSLIKTALNEGLPIKELRPDRDKFSRAIPISAMVESGKVFFRANASWLTKFEQELIAFPGGKHDDIVDAFAYISQMVSFNSGIMPVSMTKKRLSEL